MSHALGPLPILGERDAAYLARVKASYLERAALRQVAEQGPSRPMSDAARVSMAHRIQANQAFWDLQEIGR